jgi:hypothetical protein
MMGSMFTFDYASLKDLLKDTNAEVLLPNDGLKYEKSIERWSEQSIKRAVSLETHLPGWRDTGILYETPTVTFIMESAKTPPFVLLAWPILLSFFT